MASVNTTTRVEEQGDTRVAFASAPEPRRSSSVSGPKSRDPLSGGLIGDIIGMFGYAEAPSDKAINGAVDAANAMATRASALDDWKASVDDDARKITLELGVFADQAAAIAIAEDFAMLGAVDEDTGPTPAVARPHA